MDKNRRHLFIGTIAALAGVPIGTAGAAGARSLADRRRISGYLRDHAVAKLQIGAGGAKGYATWLNTDIEPQAGEAYLDATKPFPIPDGALSYIFSEHLFEHLSYREGGAMLRECRRTLKPGGKIRMATPNLLTLIQLFQDPKSEAARNYMQGKLGADYWPEELPRTVSPECVILNYEMRCWGHRFLYDERSLRQSVEQAGFQSIKAFTPGESDDPELANLEIRHKVGPHAVNDYETMVLQAVRP
jgi:predicted SAM-dependent methyltransferase